jgi:hypothetical protein
MSAWKRVLKHVRLEAGSTGEERTGTRVASERMDPRCNGSPLCSARSGLRLLVEQAGFPPEMTAVAGRAVCIAACCSGPSLGRTRYVPCPTRPIAKIPYGTNRCTPIAKQFHCRINYLGMASPDTAQVLANRVPEKFLPDPSAHHDLGASDLSG